MMWGRFRRRGKQTRGTSTVNARKNSLGFHGEPLAGSSVRPAAYDDRASSRPYRERQGCRNRAKSCIELFELGEMVVIVHQFEPVLPCARKDQKIGERSRHPCGSSAISESDGAFPDC